MRPVVGPPPHYAPAPDLDLLTLKVVSDSRVTWSTCVPILVFLGLSVLDLGPMHVTYIRDVRQTSDVHHRLMPPTRRGRGITRHSTRGIILLLLVLLQPTYFPKLVNWCLIALSTQTDNIMPLPGEYEV